MTPIDELSKEYEEYLLEEARENHYDRLANEYYNVQDGGNKLGDWVK